MLHLPFLNMTPDKEGLYEPLLGYVILEQAQAAVDMLGHRLVQKKVRKCDAAVHHGISLFPDR